MANLSANILPVGLQIGCFSLLQVCELLGQRRGISEHRVVQSHWLTSSRVPTSHYQFWQALIIRPFAVFTLPLYGGNST